MTLDPAKLSVYRVRLSRFQATYLLEFANASLRLIALPCKLGYKNYRHKKEQLGSPETHL
jgi:hypothetical protein